MEVVLVINRAAESEDFSELSSTIQDTWKKPVRLIKDPTEIIEIATTLEGRVLVINQSDMMCNSYIPSLCEQYTLPYMGSDPLTSALCQDKASMKTILTLNKIPVPLVIYGMIKKIILGVLQ